MARRDPIQGKAVYVAAPLFSDAELKFNRRLAAKLREQFSVFLPQEDGGLLDEMVARGMDAREAAKRVFLCDIAAIDRSDIVVAVLDGRTIDEGVAVEIGYAFGTGKVCYGVQTDVRRLIRNRNNPMVDGVLARVFRTPGALVRFLGRIALKNRAD